MVYRFTYGKDSKFPFQSGWTEVIADSLLRLLAFLIWSTLLSTPQRKPSTAPSSMMKRVAENRYGHAWQLRFPLR